MKKFFGWFFIVIGALNIVVSFIMIANGVTGSGSQNVGGKLFYGIGFIGLGVWMLNSASKKIKEDEQSRKNNNSFINDNND